jgi:Immunity protein 53
MTCLIELAKWYAGQCNGEWEHSKGISIRSCDNPGWWVEIDVVRTPLEERSFHSMAEGVSEAGVPQADRWLRCFVRDGVWHGAGDP